MGTPLIPQNTRRKGILINGVVLTKSIPLYKSTHGMELLCCYHFGFAAIAYPVVF